MSQVREEFAKWLMVLVTIELIGRMMLEAGL